MMLATEKVNLECSECGEDFGPIPSRVWLTRMPGEKVFRIVCGDCTPMDAETVTLSAYCGSQHR